MKRFSIMGGCLGMVLLLVLGFRLWLTQYKLPNPTGPYAVGTILLPMRDASRDEAYRPGTKRQFMIQIWYPADSSRQPIAAYQRWDEIPWKERYLAFLRAHAQWQAPPTTQAGLFPVLLFDHRWGGARTQDTALLEDLASHGYMVVAVDHPYIASHVLLPDGHVALQAVDLDHFPGNAADTIHLWNATLSTWVQDDRYVLDTLQTKSQQRSFLLYHAFDVARVGALGHSFGGAAAMALCGVDPRVVAAVNMDGWIFDGLAHRTSAHQILLLYSGNEPKRRLQLQDQHLQSVEDIMDRTDEGIVDRNLKQFGGTVLYIAASQHMDFSDQPLLPPLHLGSFTGPIAPVRMQQILRQTMLAFFNKALRQETAASLDQLPQTFHDVTMKVVAPPTPSHGHTDAAR